MSALTRKLLRDLLGMKGQVLSIALVVACAVASWSAARGTWSALQDSRDSYYERQRLADVFAVLERAPESLAARVAAVPGVRTLHTRVVERATVPFETMAEPAQAVVVSIPARGESPLNALHLRSGRFPEAGHAEEVLLGEAFARAHGIREGDRLPVVLRGVRHDVRVVGVALSPEFVFAMGAGQMTFDERRFAVLWMERSALAAAVRMEGAFNDVVLALQPGAHASAVVADVERLLEPYGKLSVVPRDKQMSANAVDGELSQLRAYASVTPLIFLGVAAFLLHLVMARLVELQRTQIAVLKAVGYGDRAIALHYLGFVAFIVAIGTALGVPVAALVGRGWTRMYEPYFRFPVLEFSLDASNVAVAATFSFVAASFGASRALWGVMRLPPAAAMMPAPPPSYRRGALASALPLVRLVGPSGRMVLREVFRRPVRVLLSALGMAAAIGIIVVGLFTRDAIRYYMDVQFALGWREDVSVAFRRPVARADMRVLSAMPGVRHVEGQRAVPVRLHAGPSWRDVVLVGHGDGHLRRLVEWPSRVVPIEHDGVTLTRVLAERLHVQPGDDVRIEVLEGARREIVVPVRGLSNEPAGMFAHARLDAVAAWLHETPSITTAMLATDPTYDAELQRALKDVPSVVGIGKTSWLLEQFEKQTADAMLAFSMILTAFGAAIAVAVVYNNARIALSTRARQLATLRVLGFTRREISTVLIGEMAVHVALSVPLGVGAARLFALGVAKTVEPEQFRLEPYIESSTYAFAIAVVVLASAASALVVRRNLDRLDLVGVLKTKE